MRSYSEIYGIGGIGTGCVYALEGNHTLGRNETRLGTKLPNRDFCKLHIISHYLTVILSSVDKNITVFPVGSVGDDSGGEEIIGLFRQYGLSEKYLQVVEDKATLSSICFQYPDGSGGNITENNSASSVVDREMLHDIVSRLKGEASIVFAAPEVPLEARLVFLKNAKEKGAFTAASFLSDEISEVFKGGGLSFIDLLSINIDEANALVEKSSGDSKAAAYSCAERILKDYSNIELVVTDGGNGMYGFSREGDEYYPALDIHAKSNAGAGDAAFAGLLIAKVLGLPFHSAAGLSGVALANSLAALSVESPDTINFTITYKSLTEFIGEAYDYSTD